MTQLEAAPLKQVEVKSNSDDSLILILKDSRNQAAAFEITPEGLNALIEATLALSVEWSTKPGLKIEELTGPENGLPAQSISFDPGHDRTETACHILLGNRIEVVFFLPLNKLFDALADMKNKLNSAQS